MAELIKFKSQLYKRIDAGEEKLSELFKRELASVEHALRQSTGEDWDVSIETDVRDGAGGDVIVTLHRPKSANIYDVHHASDSKAVNEAEKAVKAKLNKIKELPFIKARYFLQFDWLSVSGRGPAYPLVRITIRPNGFFNGIGPGHSSKSYGKNEEVKAILAVDASKAIIDNLERALRFVVDSKKRTHEAGRIMPKASRELSSLESAIHSLLASLKPLYERAKKEAERSIDEY